MRYRSAIMNFFEYIGELMLLTGATIRQIIIGAVNINNTIYQMASTGFDSIPITMITIAFSGMVFSLHTASQAHRFGADSFVGFMVAATMTRELGPVLASIVVAARVGSSIAAELGSMKVTEQIDALRALGVNPVQYLVVPRFLALILMVPALAILADVVGTIGGYVVAVASGIAPGIFVVSIQNLLTFGDFSKGILKTIVFGAVIAIVGCYEGMRTSQGASGVGKATTNSVVVTIVLIYMFDYILSQFLYSERITRF